MVYLSGCDYTSIVCLGQLTYPLVFSTVGVQQTGKPGPMSDDLQSPVQQAAEKLSAAVSDLFAVSDVTLGIPRQPDVIRLRGRLQVPSDRAYPQIAARFRQLGYTPTLRRDREQDLDILLAVPGVLPEKDTSRIWINVVLYVLTILSTLYVGASWSDLMPQDLDQTQILLWPLTHLWLGWPFALSLMVILTGHELGHYFAGRHFKSAGEPALLYPLSSPALGHHGRLYPDEGPGCRPPPDAGHRCGRAADRLYPGRADPDPWPVDVSRRAAGASAAGHEQLPGGKLDPLPVAQIRGVWQDPARQRTAARDVGRGVARGGGCAVWHLPDRQWL